jgi:hypothetical protein
LPQGLLTRLTTSQRRAVKESHALPPGHAT